MSLKTKLKKLDKDVWSGTKEDVGDSTGGFESVPSGNYIAGKIVCNLEESKSASKLQVKTELTILEGDYEGQKLWKYFGLESERGPEFFMKWLNLLGIEVDSLADDLEEALDEINKAGFVFKVGVKVTGDDTSVYFNSVEEGDEDTDDEEDDEDEEDEEDEDEDEDEDEGPDFDEMSRADLKKYISSEKLGIKVTKGMSDDDIRDAIDEALRGGDDEEDEEEEEEEKPAPKKKSPAKKSAKKAPAKKATKSGDPKILEGLADLCTAFGIDFGKDDNLKDFRNTLDDYSFKPSDLSDEEVKVLEDAGLSGIVK